LGERLNGIQEVARSIRVSSTNKIPCIFCVSACGSLEHVWLVTDSPNVMLNSAKDPPQKLYGSSASVIGC
jgi:hypothetical protein